MRDRFLRNEVLRAGAPLIIGPALVVPIERIEITSQVAHAHAWVSAAKAPHALIVRDASGTRAIGMRAETISLEEMRDKVPELDALLTAV